MSGVSSSLYSGRGPRLSVLNRQAISSLLKLLASTCATGEYLLPVRSAVYKGHSPFFVLGNAPGVPTCPATVDESRASAPTSTRSGTTRTSQRCIQYPL